MPHTHAAKGFYLPDDSRASICSDRSPGRIPLTASPGLCSTTPAPTVTARNLSPCSPWRTPGTYAMEFARVNTWKWKPLPTTHLSFTLLSYCISAKGAPARRRNMLRITKTPGSMPRPLEPARQAVASESRRGPPEGDAFSRNRKFLKSTRRGECSVDLYRGRRFRQLDRPRHPAARRAAPAGASHRRWAARPDCAGCAAASRHPAWHR